MNAIHALSQLSYDPFFNGKWKTENGKFSVSGKKKRYLKRRG
jgi:hypothetical protein